MPFRLQSVPKIGGVWTTGKSHSFHHEQRGMPAERVAQLEKAAALSPELKTGANSNHTLSMTDGAAGERVGE
jgi:hypothetical protein